MGLICKTSFAITPHNTNPILAGGYAHRLLVVATGNVSFEDLSGNTISLTSVAANTVIDHCAVRVFATGTTATVRGQLLERL